MFKRDTHGTETCYSKNGCRCDLCKKAVSEYHKSLPIKVHGTTWSYDKGCRCDACKKAKSDKWRKEHPEIKITTDWEKGLRICSTCGEMKKLENFTPRNKSLNRSGRGNECKRCHNERGKRNKNKPNHRFQTYLSGARVRKIQFDLTFEEFETFWNKPCYYCGKDIDGIGLDRKDPSDGYNMKNIVPCCTQCNRAKTIQTTEEFILMCKKVAEKFKDYIVSPR